MLEKPPVTIIDHANGGKGRIILEHIAGPETLRENARLFVKATLEKGCSMGVHKHKGDREHPVKDQYCADHGVFVIENMCNLKELLNKDVIMNTYPMRYQGMTGLPCRVVAETM